MKWDATNQNGMERGGKQLNSAMKPDRMCVTVCYPPQIFFRIRPQSVYLITKLQNDPF